MSESQDGDEPEDHQLNMEYMDDQQFNIADLFQAVYALNHNILRMNLRMQQLNQKL